MTMVNSGLKGLSMFQSRYKYIENDRVVARIKTQTCSMNEVLIVLYIMFVIII